MTRDYYHKQLYKIGDTYRKFDVAKLDYQSLISYLTNYYPDELEEIMTNIKENITKENINHRFDFYKDELPIDRLNMAKAIVLKRADWMVEHYFSAREQNRGKLLW